MGGAQRIHLDILKSIPEADKDVFFTRFSPNAVFKDEFYTVPNASCLDIHIWCDYLILRLFSVHYFSFYINRHSQGHIFGANSTFFYDMLPFINKKITRTELLHNFTFGKKGMEFFGLENYRYLDNRIIYDYFTKGNIENQYADFHIDKTFLRRILFIEPGVDIPSEKNKSFDFPLKIICAGRGGPQKRIWLVNKIAENLIEMDAAVEFHFAGTLVNELSEKIKAKALIHGEISDPVKMAALMAESDISLLTSSYEGFPMFIKESMANGCIPVVTALTGNLMHLKDRFNSMLIHEILDETKLIQEGIQIIMELIRDRKLCIQLSHEAYTYAKQHFSRNEFNKAYRKLMLFAP
jgi:glycosyltransferase involved in cell wall biosynthesis